MIWHLTEVRIGTAPKEVHPAVTSCCVHGQLLPLRRRIDTFMIFLCQETGFFLLFFFFPHPLRLRLAFGSKKVFTLSEWVFVDWADTIPPPNALTLHRESRPCSSPPRCSSVRLIEKLSARMGLRSTPTHHPERLRGWVPVRSLTALSLSLYLLRQRASRNPPDPQL